MRHARQDYNRIQDPEGLIPEEEPVMVFRAQDKCAPAALDAWCKAAKENGVDPHMIEVVHNWSREMRHWQSIHGSKIPDMPNP